ncbi:MAG: hypothetical protein IPO90_15815 [Flavobacteriales bacterium]|nr:hypothetical protein [Flavobacteriales bacterium]
MKRPDHDAEEFIVSWMREYPLATPVTLHVHLIEWPAEDPTDTIREAVHHYFAYRGQLINMEFRQLMKHARTSLLIGLVFFLTTCLITSSYFLADREGTLFKILRESLTIAGGWPCGGRCNCTCTIGGPCAGAVGSTPSLARYPWRWRPSANDKYCSLTWALDPAWINECHAQLNRAAAA